MARCRFVMPETKRLPLSDGDWIEVKKELNVGERKKLEACGVRRTTLAPPMIDWEEYHVGRVGVWLVDWSFKGPDDKPTEVSVAAIRALDGESFEEIQDALTEHIKELEEQKKVQALTRTDSPKSNASTEAT